MTYCSLPLHCVFLLVLLILLCMHITSICRQDITVLLSCLPMCLHQVDKSKLSGQAHMLCAD